MLVIHYITQLILNFLLISITSITKIFAYSNFRGFEVMERKRK